MTTHHSSGPPSDIKTVLVCRGRVCGDEMLARTLEAELERSGVSAELRLERHDCRGLCTAGPTVTLLPRGILYCRVKPEDACEIVQDTILQGHLISRLAWREPAGIEALPLFRACRLK